jgi:hypothetical protein
MEYTNFEKGLVEVKGKDGKDVAKLMALFVNSFSIDEKAFIETFSKEHRTLQQSFTKLCWLWLKKLDELGNDGWYDDRNKASVEFAQKVVRQFKDETYFPLI